MSRVGELLEALNISMRERAPEKPIKIIVFGEYFQLSLEPDFFSHTMIAPGGNGRLFEGVPIESSNSGGEGFSYKIVFPEQQE